MSDWNKELKQRFYLPEEERKHVYMSWDCFEEIIYRLALKILKSDVIITSIYGEARGGWIVAVRLSHILKIPILKDKNLMCSTTLIVDDVLEKGKALGKYHDCFPESPIATLYWCPPVSPFKPDFWVAKNSTGKWIVFPWERE